MRSIDFVGMDFVDAGIKKARAHEMDPRRSPLKRLHPQATPD
jgi:hypothetical protein